jgi:hypothetical protein
MLAYKAWRESRTRFLLSSVSLAWGCSVVVLMQGSLRVELHAQMPYSKYIWSAVYKSNGLRDLYLVLVLTLGLGGLLPERARGTSGFTLALPVSRFRLVATRAMVGLAELTAADRVAVAGRMVFDEASMAVRRALGWMRQRGLLGGVRVRDPVGRVRDVGRELRDPAALFGAGPSGAGARAQTDARSV